MSKDPKAAHQAAKPVEARAGHSYEPPYDRYWLIHFEDASRPDEVFTDEEAARATLGQYRIAWNCTLFAQVEPEAQAPESVIQEAIKRFRSASDFWPSSREDAEILARAADALLKEHTRQDLRPWCFMGHAWPCPVLSEIVRGK